MGGPRAPREGMWLRMFASGRASGRCSFLGAPGLRPTVPGGAQRGQLRTHGSGAASAERTVCPRPRAAGRTPASGWGRRDSAVSRRQKQTQGRPRALLMRLRPWPAAEVSRGVLSYTHDSCKITAASLARAGGQARSEAPSFLAGTEGAGGHLEGRLGASGGAKWPLADTRKVMGYT